MASVGIATAPGAARTRRPRSRRSLTRGSGLGAGRHDDLVQPAGADPADGSAGLGSGTGARRVLAGHHATPDRRRAAAHRHGVARGHRGQRRDGYGARLGPRAGPVLGQEPRRRRHRRAVRAADDRRGAGAALPLRTRVAAGRERGEHPHRGVPRARLRDAALRCPHRPAGAGVSRARRRGGSRLTRRRAVDGVPPGDPAVPDPGDRGRRGTVLRTGDQRVRVAGAALRQPARPRPRSPRCAS